MIYLLLAILSSALVSIIMRFSEKHIQNNMAMFTVNYTICLLLAKYFMGDINFFIKEEGIYTALFLGVTSGFLYLANFVLLQKTMDSNGVIIASTAMKLGAVLIPSLVAVFIFKETPGILQLTGIIIAIAAIILINVEKGAFERKGSKLLVVILLLGSGLTDTMANIFDKTGVSALKDHYLFYTFLAALLIALLMTIVKRKKVIKWDILFGILIAVPNYFSSRFLLLSLGNVPAVITYPVYSVGTIILVSMVGISFFKEKLSRQKYAALFLILIALVLLNI